MKPEIQAVVKQKELFDYRHDVMMGAARAG
jgi:hypothetical protein